MHKLTKIALSALVMFPALVFAQGRITFLLTDVRFIINTLITIVAGLALLVFFWGLVRFIFKLGSEADIEQGRKLMVWGLIALFVMISVWGIIRFIELEVFGTLDKSDPTIPSFRP